MTYEETVALLYLAKRLYPRDSSLNRSPEEMAEVGEAWAKMLQDIPFEVGKAALAAHAATSPYPPAISEIRDFARKLTSPQQLTADEAWAKAIRAVQHYGVGEKNFTTGKYPHEMARESVPEEVWAVMELLGYRNMCRSENVNVLRGQFIQAWERRQKVRQERESLLPFLPAGLKEQFLALTDGTAEQKLPYTLGNGLKIVPR